MSLFSNDETKSNDEFNVCVYGNKHFWFAPLPPF